MVKKYVRKKTNDEGTFTITAVAEMIAPGNDSSSEPDGRTVFFLLLLLLLLLLCVSCNTQSGNFPSGRPKIFRSAARNFSVRPSEMFPSVRRLSDGRATAVRRPSDGCPTVTNGVGSQKVSIQQSAKSSFQKRFANFDFSANFERPFTPRT